MEKDWFKAEKQDIVERLINTLESEALQFIGKFNSVEDKDFGFFIPRIYFWLNFNNGPMSNGLYTMFIFKSLVVIGSINKVQNILKKILFVKA